jgi:hypothetical protein
VPIRCAALLVVCVQCCLVFFDFYLVVFNLLRQYNIDYPYSHLQYTSDVIFIFRTYSINIDKLLLRLNNEGESVNRSQMEVKQL